VALLLAIGSVAFTAEPMGLAVNRVVRTALASVSGAGGGSNAGGNGGGGDGGNAGGGGGGWGGVSASPRLPLIEPMLVCMTAGLLARNFPGNVWTAQGVGTAARKGKRRGDARPDTAGGGLGAAPTGAGGAGRGAGGAAGKDANTKGGEADTEGRDGRARAALTKLLHHAMPEVRE
jgi:hypothetical protein